MPLCFSCREPLEVAGRVGRKETCSRCGADCHCCRNCTFYDPHVYNQCREPQAERVLDKEKGNFCDFFQPAEVPFSNDPKGPQDEAKKRLEGLFKKK